MYTSKTAGRGFISLGICLRDKNPTNTNRFKTLFQAELEALGEEGDSDANFMLGLRAYHGADSSPAPRVAAVYWRHAAEKGHTDAMYSLSLLYLNGRGVQASPKKAIELLYHACSRHHPGALNRLGCHFWWGDVVSQDREKALTLFTYAHQLGSAEAAYNLGIYCLSPTPSYNDVRSGIHYLCQAAQQYLPEAMAQLAACFDGKYPLFEDRAASRQWRELAARFDHLPSQLHLASHYLYIDKSQKAYQWLHRAAQQGHAPRNT
ncbi:tetratricopeptide repeat protein [Halomonas vilamensis]|uniref:Tetratricopeptide repeat protein n=1 Tax=Vreelandella vilamensis TaxID=531309 RepID=A0ABU1H6R9_9GAMM|nr:tetratricopeptide repeat protein [Halomonas vilamensis]MDR5899218.1 tetratricopeptide repeat protein [Halomonas vilamensis]